MGAGTISLSNHPNPFDSFTQIVVETMNSEELSLTVYNSTGQLVERVFQGNLSPGKHSFPFDVDHSGSSLYICVLKSGSGFSSHLMFTTK